MKNLCGKKLSKFLSFSIVGLSLCFYSCSKDEQTDKEKDKKPAQQTEASTQSTSNKTDDGKGIGTIKNVDIPANIDVKLANDGKKTFEMKCSACHNITSRKVGPALKGVTLRRKPEWIMNMILNPAEMTQKDPTAKELLGEYMTQMANQSLDEKGARSVLEYFRSNDKK